MFQALRKAVSGNYTKDPRSSLVQDEYRKKNLKENLALHIKKLQKGHIQDGQVIERNDEDAANICQALEAIFLHEYQLQSNTIPNLNNINLRMMFTENIKTDDAIISIAFWGLLKEVTHNDVITELKHLVVTTEVGLCRAWIRLALNDGLLVSYIAAILANTSQLKHFYGVNAFLMDSELPYILKELLQGLMQFEFRLNYNSSKLNTWDKKTLHLAGILECVGKDNEKNSLDNYIHNSPRSSIKTISITDTRNTGDKRNLVRSTSTSRDGITEKIKSNVSNAIARSLSTSTEIVTEKLKTNVSNVFARIVSKPELESDDDVPKPVINKEKFEHIPNIDEDNTNVSNPEMTECQNNIDTVINVSTSSNIEDVNLSKEEEGVLSTACNVNEHISTLENDGDKSLPICKCSGDENITPEDNVGRHLSESKKKEDLKNVSESKTDKGKIVSISTNVGDRNVSRYKIDLETNISSTPNDKVEEHISAFKSNEDKNPSTSKNNERNISLTSANNGDKNISIPRTDGDLAIPKNDGQNLINDKTKQLISLPRVGVGHDIATKSKHNEDSNASISKNEKNILSNKSKIDPDSINCESSSDDSTNVLSEKDLLTETRVQNDLEKLSIKNENDKRAVSIPEEYSSHQQSSEIVAPKVESNILKCVSDTTVISDSSNESSVELCENVDVNINNKKIETSSADDLLPGNRLNGMGWSGWSSAFDNTNDIGDSMDVDTSSNTSPVSDGNEFSESFGSILQIYGNSPNYVPAEYYITHVDSSSEVKEILNQEESNLLPDLGSNSSSAQELIHLNFEVVPLSAPLQGDNVDKETLSSLKQLTEIAPEKGLDKQSFCCQHCGVLIGLIYGPYRVCRYDGAYYCYDCHDDEEHIIPARVIQDWDFRKYKVSKYNKLFLMKIEEEPLFHIDELNSLLYDVSTDLSEMKNLRIQLQHIKEYVQTCREEVAEDFRRRLWPREYLCDDIHQYSLLDLLQVYNGQQAHHLKKVITQFSKHIFKCTLCRQKGFICEYCHDSTIIYPFQVNIAVQCPGCLATFHNICRQDKRCPKCVRIRLRLQSKDKKENETDRLLVTQKEQFSNGDIL